MVPEVNIKSEWESERERERGGGGEETLSSEITCSCIVGVSVHTNNLDFICLQPNGGKWNLIPISWVGKLTELLLVTATDFWKAWNDAFFIYLLFIDGFLNKNR